MGIKSSSQRAETKSHSRKPRSVSAVRPAQKAVPDRNQEELVSQPQGNSGQVGAGREPGRLEGLPVGRASGIGDSQGSGMGKTAHARFGAEVGPSFIRFSHPEYPASARRRGISGLVVLRVLIRADGKAERIEVISSVDASLSRSACTAVRNAVFAPYKPYGKPVDCWTELPIRFRLENAE